uniref:o-succinylbenzoate synthase n=1 Tax=Cyanobium sp. TaxID=2164130 RepID=UPI0040495BBF
MGERLLRLAWRPFQFHLPQAMVTAHGALAQRRGWLLRLESPDGRLGWGEALALEPEQGALASALAGAIQALPPCLSRPQIEAAIGAAPKCLAFALGAALAELDGLGSPGRGGWLPAPASAWLLPAGERAVEELERVLASGPTPPAFKWKVAALPASQELDLLELLVQRLPAGALLRLDANGGWDRATAAAWADRLANEPRLEWLEQPLEPLDQEGLEALAARVPVALDESLRVSPVLAASWPCWQVRRPLLEGDPRPLLAAFEAGQPHWMVSTALETGIGRRWVHHLAGLQALGPTPTAPGLAPGWCPQGDLFSSDPQLVWQAAA